MVSHSSSFRQASDTKERRHTSHHGSLFGSPAYARQHNRAQVNAASPGANARRRLFAQRACFAYDSGEEDAQQSFLLQTFDELFLLLR